jgi:hypothetical protein
LFAEGDALEEAIERVICGTTEVAEKLIDV